MTENEKITFIRAVGDFNEKDSDDEYIESNSVISSFLTIAKSGIMNRLYPYGYDESMVMPTKYETLQCNIAIYLMNKRGAEGQMTHEENGIARSYGASYIPDDMLTEVIPHCSSIGGAYENS